MILAALALAVGLLCAGAAAARWHGLGSRDPRTPAPGRRGEALAARVVGPKDAEAMVQAMRDAPTQQHRVAELNERRADVARHLAASARVPRAASRVALSTGTLLALIQVATDLRSGEPSLYWAGLAFAVGVSCALAAQHFGRLADSRSAARWQDWREATRLLLGHEAPVDPDALDRKE